MERGTENPRKAHKSGTDIAATLASDSSIDRYLNEYSSAVRDPLFEIKAEGTTVHLDVRRYSAATGRRAAEPPRRSASGYRISLVTSFRGYDSERHGSSPLEPVGDRSRVSHDQPVRSARGHARGSLLCSSSSTLTLHFLYSPGRSWRACLRSNSTDSRSTESPSRSVAVRSRIELAGNVNFPTLTLVPRQSESSVAPLPIIRVVRSLTDIARRDPSERGCMEIIASNAQQFLVETLLWVSAPLE